MAYYYMYIYKQTLVCIYKILSYQVTFLLYYSNSKGFKGNLTLFSSGYLRLPGYLKIELL